MSTLWSFLEFYRDWLVGQWNDITPIRYGILLIVIGIGGYWLMGRGFKRI